MKTLTLTARLLCATAAAAPTLVLFTAVAQLSEPQRSVLIAKTLHRADPTLPGLAPTQVIVAMASTAAASARSVR